MPNTTQSASWDFNPTDPVRLAASFSFDTEDTQDAAPVAAALAAIQARLASAALDRHAARRRHNFHHRNHLKKENTTKAQRRNAFPQFACSL